MYYAYKIVNQINQKVYVGITCNPDNRWKRHQSNARSDSPKARYRTYLYNAMRKHGIDNFKFSVIATFTDRRECELFEVLFIAAMRAYNVLNYNLHDGGTLGYNMQTSTNYEQWKLHLKASAIANSSDSAAKEAWIQKLKEKRKGRTPALGMKHSNESKATASKVSNSYWDTQITYARDDQKVKAILALSHKEAKLQFGISTTHYYRLKKRFAINASE